ncbi:MAG: DUF4271 domain-containing protein [Flavobacteriales bacterium]|nr:DUF4271 domain-containing protein [Flavobacteriales bacterium]
MAGQFLLINMQSNDWINIIFILIFILLALNKWLFQKRFGLLLSGIFNRKYFSFYIKDTPLITSTFNIIFFLINLLITSLVVFFISQEYYLGISDSNNLEVFLYAITGVFLFYLMKIIFRFVISLIISTSKSVRQFSFFKLSIRSLSSIVLLPFLLIHQYSVLDKSLTLTILLSVFIALLTIQYIYSTQLIIAKKQYPFLYIFLYLCTLEIIPTVIFIKFVFIIVNNDFHGF